MNAELLQSSKDFTDKPPADKSDTSIYNVSSRKSQRYTLVVKKKVFAFAMVNFVLTKFEGKMQEVKIPIKMAKAKPGLWCS